MQKFISKYGLAAHLALLAVTPLFLLSYLDAFDVAMATLWLSLFAIAWTFVSPSIRPQELLFEARSRVFWSALKDPVLWLMLLTVAVSGLVWANSGVGLAYDFEHTEWTLRRPALSAMPGSVSGTGALPFAATFAALAVATALRHAVGRRGRSGFMVAMTVFAGVSGALSAWGSSEGLFDLAKWAQCPMTDLRSFVGTTYGVFFLAGIATMAAAYQLEWLRVFPVILLAQAGTFAGLYVFAPASTIVVFVIASLILFVYSCIHVGLYMGMAAALKFFIFYALSIALGSGLAYAVMPSADFTARYEAIFAFNLFPAWFCAARETVTGIASRTWSDNPWVGVGLGSFPVWLKFGATPEELGTLPATLTAPLNGWWTFLAERGIVGTLTLVALFGGLLCTWVIRLVKSIRKAMPAPACWMALVAIAAVAVEALWDDAFMRPDVLLILVTMTALSAGFFPKEQEHVG